MGSALDGSDALERLDSFDAEGCGWMLQVRLERMVHLVYVVRRR
jgi:hypothetical protein